MTKTRRKPQRLGRPALPDADALVVGVQARVTETEYKKLYRMANASKLSLSAWLRRAIGRGHDPGPEYDPS